MSRPPAESDVQTTQFVVDATVLAHGDMTWEHAFSHTRFGRLVDVALSATPDVSVKLKFAMLDNRPVIHGELRATVELVCQRCLGVMQHPVMETFDLMLVENEAGLDRVPESHEPWLANALCLNVLELVEEQLLLALPLIARHDDERHCVDVDAALAEIAESSPDVRHKAPASDEVAEVQRPFGHLRDLLRKKD